MKYYLIAGEASGDLHASNLIKAIKSEDPDAQFRAFGGDLMAQAGAHVHIHYRDVAMMGLVEVIRKFRTIHKYRQDCRNDLLQYHPDVLILVDYSGFNLPMARFAAKNNIRVIYYISPKLWAWAKWRVKTIRESVYRMFVILPFEVDFYKQHGVEAEYYGNPVLDSISAYDHGFVSPDPFRKDNNLEEKPIVALLAGSRKQEIDLLLPEMLAVIPFFPEYQFVIAGAPSIDPSYYALYTKETKVQIVYGQTYRLLKHATAAIVTSGTATLETALFQVPQVVVYKTNPVTFFIGNLLVKIKFFSLVNLILDKEAVQELLQDNLAENIKTELDRILKNKEYREQMMNDYVHLRHILKEPGVAHKVARRICQIAGVD